MNPPTDLPTEVRELPARLRFAGAEPTPAVARVAERGKSWRTRGALKQIAIWWGLALATIFIPLLHFVLPPLFVLVGIWRAYSAYTETRTLLSLRGPCPKCGTEQEFTELGRLKGPHTVTCAHCRWKLQAEIGRT